MSELHAGEQRLPDFLVIGAAKSATSTLATLLAMNPRIFISPTKEPEFFAVDDVFERGIEWYRELFRGAGDDQLCGEASTAYTRWPQLPHAAERIARHIPHAKLIYIMRHPVDRAYSHYVHRLTKELHPGEPIRSTFEEHVRHDLMCLDGSRYVEQIDRYLVYFPKKAFCFLLTEDLEQSPQETMTRVFGFLGVPTIELNRPGLRRNDAARQRQGKIRASTTAPLRAIPGLAAVASRTPRAWRDGVFRMLSATPYGKWMRARHTAPPMRPETRQALLKEFEPLNAKLARLIDRDLGHWYT